MKEESEKNEMRRSERGRGEGFTRDGYGTVGGLYGQAYGLASDDAELKKGRECEL